MEGGACNPFRFGFYFSFRKTRKGPNLCTSKCQYAVNTSYHHQKKCSLYDTGYLITDTDQMRRKPNSVLLAYSYDKHLDRSCHCALEVGQHATRMPWNVVYAREHPKSGYTLGCFRYSSTYMSYDTFNLARLSMILRKNRTHPTKHVQLCCITHHAVTVRKTHNCCLYRSQRQTAVQPVLRRFFAPTSTAAHL